MDKAYARPTARARNLRSNPTDAERALWNAISARKIMDIRFNRQVPIGPYICDFVARSLRLVIEIDGGQHNDAVDARRTAFIENQGFTVIRFWNHDVLSNLNGVVRQISLLIADSPSPDPSRKREGRFSDAFTPCP